MSAIVLAAAHHGAAAQPVPATSPQPVNQFALDLYGRLCRGSGNLILSPLSVSSALGMAHAGAAGRTAQEIAAVLHIPPDAGEAATEYAALVQSLHDQNAANVKLSVANALWGEPRLQFKKAFLDVLEQRYGAAAVSLDFAHDPERARRKINDWVADRTAGRIQGLLVPGSIDRITRLVLTNAIYFKGAWDHRFEASKTQDAAFAAADGSKVTVAMMQRSAAFGYARGYDYAVLELLYEGRSLAMDVFLPDLQDGLPALEKHLSEDALRRDWAALRVQTVAAEIPRFTMNWGSELTGDLEALGMREAFAPGADFSLMSGLTGPITQVVHKAFIEVNEQGTEAAAATGLSRSASMARPAPVFRADHPFLFLIRDVKRGTILFMGRLVQPAR